METLPRRSEARQQLTGLICPDCGGVLSVTSEGNKGFLHFSCRVGHTQALDCLIAAKERQIEETLWTCIMRFEELAALMADARNRADPSAGRWVDAEGRIARLRAAAIALRNVLGDNEPIDLGVAVPSEEGA